MGGCGSRRRSSWNAKPTTGRYDCIDIRRLKQQGCLVADKIGILTWSNRGEKTGVVLYRMIEEGMILKYQYRENGSPWVSVDQFIRFDRTPCNYGGYRKWFLCSHCGKRVAVLYLAGRLFLCRHCYGLVYGSQQEVTSDRLMRAARKIRHRLGAGDDLTIPIWQKPKGMHEKTYLRLRAEANFKTYRANDLMIQSLMAMMRQR
mgnify:CR=1 FL=1